ncbi:hypothetical protein [Streptomyces sp. NPDC050564]|uniref:hypothetical protein n=1 Tax=Streptomyces sp. NPDC050564 TaxID=3365631 RepID=UPI0037BC46C6
MRGLCLLEAVRRTDFPVRAAGSAGHHAPVYDNSTSRQAIEFLLGLIGSDDAERVRQHIGLQTPFLISEQE